MDNATSTNKNRYILGWSMELIQHGVLDLIRVPFLITGHTKFAPDRVFASIGSSYIHSDVFNVGELVAIADQFSTAKKLERMYFIGGKNSTRNTLSFKV